MLTNFAFAVSALALALSILAVMTKRNNTVKQEPHGKAEEHETSRRLDSLECECRNLHSEIGGILTNDVPRLADSGHDDPMFIEVTDVEGKTAMLNIVQIRSVYIPKVDGAVEIVHGTGNGYVEIPMREYEEKLKPILLKVRM